FGNIFKECVLHIQTANNLVVVKTVSGGANSAGAFIDNLNLNDLLGSIAGDDTIIAVASSEEAATAIANTLKSYF
ncbi:MAG: arginine repressor, partial [Clostridia bacterium]